MDNREKLLREMLHRFPELPAETVQAHVNLYPRNREALVSELTKVSSVMKSLPRGEESLEGGEMLYSNFEPSVPLGPTALGSLPLPEPPPSLVITPPASPEKATGNFPGSASETGGGNSSYVPALSIAPGSSGINLGYEEFLLQNQRQRLKALEEAYKKNEACLAELRREVLAKERFLFENTLLQSSDDATNNSHVNITVETLLELTQENRRLSVQNQCLITEVDLQTDGRAPLGDVTRNAFYDQIYPGPRDPLVEIDSRSPSRNPTVSSMSAGRSSAGNGTINMDDATDDDTWACTKCTLRNHSEIRFCDACNFPRQIEPNASFSRSPSIPSGRSISLQRLNSASSSRSTGGTNLSQVNIVPTVNSAAANNSGNSKYPRIVKEASSSSDSSLSLSDSSSSSSCSCGCNDAKAKNDRNTCEDDDENEADVQVEVTRTEDRGTTRSPICLRIRQRTPRDSITFRFYKNINRD